nr:MAG TPA: hypothetical protein [Caudoviricetes sp.]
MGIDLSGTETDSRGKEGLCITTRSNGMAQLVCGEMQR